MGRFLAGDYMKKIIYIPLVVIAIVLVSWQSWIYLINRSVSITPVPFSAAEWRTSNLIQRGAMINDLLKREKELLIGKTEAQVESMLGSPVSRSSEMLSYQIDIGHRFFGDPWLYYFTLEFGRDGTVVEVTFTD